MIIHLNGKMTEISPWATLNSIIEESGLKPGQVVIELNQEIVDKKKYAEVKLRENDVIEILEFVGGG